MWPRLLLLLQILHLPAGETSLVVSSSLVESQEVICNKQASKADLDLRTLVPTSSHQASQFIYASHTHRRSMVQPRLYSAAKTLFGRAKSRGQSLRRQRGSIQ